MKLKIKSALRTLHSALRTETIARFGDARLVKKFDGKIQLLAGSRDDRADAREWWSLFMHEVLISLPHEPAEAGQKQKLEFSQALA